MGIEKPRALKEASESADVVGRVRRNWVRNHDAEVARLRREIVATSPEDRRADIAEIDEATKAAVAQGGRSGT